MQLHRPEAERQIDFARFVLPVLDALGRMGLNAEMSARNDLTIDGKKFSGSAQYHHNGRVLHHGSILFCADLEEMTRCLSVDDEKLSVKGIRSIRQRVTNLKERLRPEMDAVAFKRRLLALLLPEGVRRETLEDGHAGGYAASARRNLKAGIGCSAIRRISGGPLQAPARRPGRDSLNLEKGRIADLRIAGDFFFAGDLDQLVAKLKGCRYDGTACARRWRTRRGTGASTRSGWTNCFFACSRSTRRPPVPLRFPVHLRGGICARVHPAGIYHSFDPP